MTYAVGTLTTFTLDDFPGTAFTIIGSTRKATTYTTQGATVRPRTFVLPSGAVASYDSNQSPVVQGAVTQEFIDSDGATFLDNMHEYIGWHGTLVYDPDDTGSNQSISAILVKVEDTTPIDGKRAKVWGRLTFQPYGSWS